MTTNFPTSLDTLTNPASTDSVSTVSHSAQHANANDAIEALQAKVGADSSAVTTSHDYKLSEVTSTDKAVGKTATQTLTNKTLTSPTINSGTINTPTIAGSTGTGVHDFGGASSFELPNSATPTVDADGEIALDTTVTDFSHGILKFYGGEEQAIISVPVAELTSPANGDIITYNSTADEFQLAQPAEVTVKPSVLSYDWTGGNSLTGYMDSEAIVAYNGGVGIYLSKAGAKIQIRTITADYASATRIDSAVVLGTYLYLLLINTTASPDQRQVWRYSLSDLTSSPTQVTFSGSNQLANSDSGIRMTCDGTNFYFSFLAGNSANSYVIGKYTLSGTVLTYSSTITLSDSTAFTHFATLADGDVVIIATSDSTIRRYNSSGTHQTTSGFGVSYTAAMLNFTDTIYIASDTSAIKQFNKIFVE